jgi:hypothetical protein
MKNQLHFALSFEKKTITKLGKPTGENINMNKVGTSGFPWCTGHF